MISTYDQVSSEGRQKLQSDFPEVGSFLREISSQAQRVGLPIWQWAQRTGPEFIEGFCNLAILASRYTQHLAVAVPARVCTFGQLAPRAAQHIEKAQVFFSKKHERRGKSQGSDGQAQHVGAHQPIMAPEILSAFPKAVPVKGKTYVQGGGKIRERWKDKDYIYEWDSRHGTVEKYNQRGGHLGEFDARTGKQLKPADPTRRTGP